MLRFVLFILLLIWSTPVNAQSTAEQVVPGILQAGSTGPSWVPISSTNPLPIGVYDAGNHSGYCFTSNGSASAATFQACGSGSVTWPTSGDVVISNSTSSPSGIAPSGTNCLVGNGSGAWTTGSCGGTSAISIGTTTISGGTTTRVLYDNSGVVGEYTVTGSGNAVLSASPTLSGTVDIGTGSITMTGSLGLTGSRLTKGWFTDLQVTNAISGSITGNAATATALLNARTIGGTSFDGTANITVATATGGFTVSGGNLTVSGINIVTDTSTGTKIGTATNQKLAFYNSSPIVQPSGSVITALSNLGLVATPTIGIGDLTAIGSNTVVANIGTSSAAPTAAALPSCIDSGGNHLNYTLGTGFSCGSSGGGTSSIAIGTTTITGGTTTRILYDNAGVAGEYTLTGSGTVVVMQNTPTLTTPVLGVATGTSLALSGNMTTTAGVVAIGSSAANTGVSLDLGSETNSLLLPTGTTGTRPTGINGMLRYNNTANTKQVVESYQNSQWLTLNPLYSSGLDTTASGSTNSTALQAAINNLVTLGTSTLSTDFGINGLQIAQGTYSMTTGVTSQPWIKIQAKGNVLLDFSSAATGVHAVSINNDHAPSGSFTSRLNSANVGPMLDGLDGTLAIVGSSSADTTSFGLTVGSGTTAPGTDANMRETRVTGVSIEGFGDCLHLKPYSLYMMHWDHLQLGGCTNAIGMDNVTPNVNSGENLVFQDITMVDSTNGVNVTTPNMDFVFDGGSCDFNTNCWTLSSKDIYAKHTMNHYHIEAVNKIVNGDSGHTAYQNLVKMVMPDNKFVSNSSGANAPTQLFTGGFFLDLDELFIGGWNNQSTDPANLFMTDSKVIPLRNPHLFFTTYPQVFSQYLIDTDDPCFAQGTNGNDIQSSPTSTIMYSSSSNITAAIATDQVWTTGFCSSSKSIKYTRTGTANSYVVYFDRFRVNAGDQLVGDVVFRTDTASSTAQVQLQFQYTSCNSAIAATNDGSFTGDTIGTDGGANTWFKMANLRDTVVPANVCYAQLGLTVSSMGVSEHVWVGAVVENRE